MTDKHGTFAQQRGARFNKFRTSSTCHCRLNNVDVAIVPVRYALDRSHFDAEPEKLKPLSSEGQWSRLPRLKTRSYTLRQFYDGYQQGPI